MCHRPLCRLPRLLLVLLAFVVGCMGGSRKLPVPELNPSAAGASAVELGDKDGDGLLRGEELDAVPSLKASLHRIDADKDGALSAVEIADRVKAWKKEGVAVTPLDCKVIMNGKPVVQATVRLVPEAFLGNDIQTAEGISNEFGIAYLTIPVEKRPVPNMPDGVQSGFFRIEVTKQENGQETIPTEFNVNTKLGFEMSYDNPQIRTLPMVITLQ